MTADDYLAVVTVEPPQRWISPIPVAWWREPGSGRRHAADNRGDFYREVYPSELPYPYRCALCGRLFWHGWLGPNPREYCLTCIQLVRHAPELSGVGPGRSRLFIEQIRDDLRDVVARRQSTG